MPRFSIIHIGDHPHNCALPGWWKRRRLSLHYNAIIQCNQCFTRWIWKGGYDGPSWYQLSTEPQSVEAPRPCEGEDLYELLGLAATYINAKAARVKVCQQNCDYEMGGDGTCAYCHRESDALRELETALRDRIAL